MSVCTSPLEMIAPPTGRCLSLSEARRQCRIDDDMTADDDTLYGLIDDVTEFIQQEVYGQRQLLTATYRLRLPGFWGGTLQLPRPPLALVDAVKYYAATTDTLTTLSAASYIVRKPWQQPGTVELHHDYDWPDYNSERREPVLVEFTAGYATPFTASAGTDIITATGRSFTDGDSFQLSKAADAVLPGGLALNKTYYARDSSGATCKLAETSGGSAIDLTTDGTGLFFVGEIPRAAKRAMLMLLAHWYRNRESVIAGTISKEIEFSVDACLKQLGWGSYA